MKNSIKVLCQKHGNSFIDDVLAENLRQDRLYLNDSGKGIL